MSYSEINEELIYSSIYPDVTPVPNTNFCQLFLETIHGFGGKIGLIDPDVDRRVAYSEISILIQKCQRQLIANGIGKNDCVGSICGNSIDFIVLSLAMCKIGVPLCPLNPALKKYEISKYLLQSECSIVIVDEEYKEKVVATIEEEKLNVRIIGMNDLFNGDNEITQLQPDADDGDSSLTAFIFFSSGTTGPPKPVELGHNALNGHLLQIKCVQSHHGPMQMLSTEDIVYGVLPYFHAGGLLTVLCMLAQSTTVVVNKRFSEENFLQTIEQYKVTVINVVPPILDVLSVSPLLQSHDLSLLHTIFVGAAKVSSELIVKVKGRLPKVEITQLFGMTEAGILIFMTPRGNTKYASVGQAMPGVKFKIVPVDSSDESVGELWVKTPCIMKGYKNAEEKSINQGCTVSSQSIVAHLKGIKKENVLVCSLEMEKNSASHYRRPMEWFNTGDLARVDAHGNVFIEGRTKEMIKVKGWQVSPYELEEAIKTLPGIVDCAVIGIQTKDCDGHRPKAFIVGNCCPSDVMKFVHDNFISYKHLVGVSIVPELPRNASGKLCRIQLNSIDVETKL